MPSYEKDGVPRLFRSPLQLSDAVRRLAIAANDHTYDFLSPGSQEDNENILRIMNNLLSFSQPQSTQVPPQSARGPETENTENSYSLHPKIAVVSIKDLSPIVGAHKSLAIDYETHLGDPLHFCKMNSEIARKHSRNDHARMFNTLVMLFEGDQRRNRSSSQYYLMPQKPPDLLIEAL